ncbi:N-acylglucosamine-6-phosphate 2-epimerase [Beutenbergia cavernae DSM 12333]|uniref:Putative N-acetylmannosamine-6-phosphate 2-epimerase n=1 Tax=Beutenbergia cavernae (strain ATCC BAA-8 / DSM 12333 / CCUG 43141 / JCM 11478 / NBRC 16432 / NCIMB 13614 / HKI 0122) TaxID=471853 RepID=C5C3V2_BEUC1|nr:N-acetylmannosamine-6-phosphate 2-epimerase [Beutenbergia cavernae]ACQ82011.1 N-acylglucosamine-6-phosphate 2-epimerase [Beutenbergia cavernae DSM 12333]
MTTAASVPPDAVERLRGGLIVSCQAYPGEPMRDPRTTAQVARAAVAGGAAGVRVQGLEDVESTSHALDVPVVGLWKHGDADVFITPTLEHAVGIARAGADIVALDGTRRPRPDGLTLVETIRRLRVEVPAVLVMADCGSLDDALAAQVAGADLVGTTLAGYTGERARTTGADLELVAELVGACRVPVVVEGRVHTPDEAAAAMALGAHAVCVGTAITHPTTITSWFARAVQEARSHPGEGAGERDDEH